MKKLLYLFRPAIIMLLATCAAHEDTHWLQQLIGTYVTHYRQAYGMGWDTLTIQPIQQGEQVQYRIIRFTRYQRIRNGIVEAPQFKRNTWLVKTSHQDHTLTIIPTGRIYHYDEKKNTIITGRTLYQKIK